MKKSFLSALLAFGLSLPSQRAVTMGSFAHGEPKEKTTVTPWEVKMANYLKGLPNDVVLLIQRMDNCDHWAGEDGYDEERAKEIEAAVSKLKCESIDADRARILKKYKSKKSVVNKIKNYPAGLE